MPKCNSTKPGPESAAGPGSCCSTERTTGRHTGPGGGQPESVVTEVHPARVSLRSKKAEEDRACYRSFSPGVEWPERAAGQHGSAWRKRDGLLWMDTARHASTGSTSPYALAPLRLCSSEPHSLWCSARYSQQSHPRQEISCSCF
jgi:hypothetical protein